MDARSYWSYLISLSVLTQVFCLPLLGAVADYSPNKKRLLAIANFNTDISDFWEFSATGFRPIDESNEAYKLGVNYIMYGMTH